MGQTLKKYNDWVSRLDLFVQSHSQCCFEYGVLDCALYVCDAIRSMTGVDVGEAFRETYHSKKDAALIVKEYGGLEEIGDTIAKGYGMHAVASNFAGRGDPVVFIYEGVQSFGFISLSGREVCGLSERGNTAIPRAKTTIIRAWSFE